METFRLWPVQYVTNICWTLHCSLLSFLYKGSSVCSDVLSFPSFPKVIQILEWPQLDPSCCRHFRLVLCSCVQKLILSPWSQWNSSLWLSASSAIQFLLTRLPQEVHSYILRLLCGFLMHQVSACCWYSLKYNYWPVFVVGLACTTAVDVAVQASHIQR